MTLRPIHLTIQLFSQVPFLPNGFENAERSNDQNEQANNIRNRI